MKASDLILKYERIGVALSDQLKKAVQEDVDMVEDAISRNAGFLRDLRALLPKATPKLPKVRGFGPTDF